jgi:uncharacterized Rossmann fold enzyme
MEPELPKAINFYPEYKEWYYKIIKEFSYDEKMDIFARDKLLEILQESPSFSNFNQNATELRKIIQKKKFISIFGCGPSLEDVMNRIIENNELDLLRNSTIISADGAAVYLDEIGLRSNLIFTDLDGIPLEDFSRYVDKTDFMVVHAHGDNIRKLNKISEILKKSRNIIGTTQVEPESIILNPGGFTDGDRIVFFVKNLLLPTQIRFLIGMDFGNNIGRYSKPEFTKNQRATLSKVKKLEYAKNLLEWILKNTKTKTYFVGSEIISSVFQYIYPSKYIRFLKGESV